MSSKTGMFSNKTLIGKGLPPFEIKNCEMRKDKETQKKRLVVGLVETDPVRAVGFVTLFNQQSDIEIQITSLPEIAEQPEIKLLLLSNDRNRSLAEVIAELKIVRTDLRILVVGNNANDKAIFDAIMCGAKGYVNESESAGEFARAIQLVNEGHVWAPRRVLATLVDRIHSRRPAVKSPNRNTLTSREKQVLEMLVAGCSNKEISEPLGIEVRTVKSHIAKMMRKVNVTNRVALSVHAVTHSLIGH